LEGQFSLRQPEGVPEQMMPKINMSVGAGEPPEATRDSAAAEVRERRESERLITDWERETRRLGQALTLMALDISAMTGPKWAYRFIIAISPVVEDSSLLFYGAGLATLLELPERAADSAPTLRQLPARYVPVFSKGCIALTLSGLPIRMHGVVEREGRQQELYRAAFIRLSIEANRGQHSALGAFNCRVAERWR
jgi:hypothetical protein